MWRRRVAPSLATMSDPAPPPSPPTRARGIGVIGAAAIGVGGMVGGGIFAVLGTAVGLAGGGTPVAFAAAGVVALLTSYSYVKLSVRYPSSGGTIVFLDRAFGVDLVTGVLNLVLWLSYLVTIALYASAFGSYGSTFFDDAPTWLRHALVSAAIVVPAAINSVDATIVSKSETFVVAVKLALLALVIGAGASAVDPSRLAPETWASPLSLLVGGMVIFVAYEGFELIANAAEDVRDPARTLPRAYYLCVGFVVVLYVLVAVVTVGSVDAATIDRAKDYALAEAAKPSLGQAGFVLVSVSALLATFSAINATVYGNARLGYSLAKDGELPRVLARESRGLPIDGIAATTVIALLIANFVDLDAIAILGSAGFLLIFTAVNASCVKLAKDANASRVVAALATIACAGALVALLAHTYEDSPRALGIFAGLVAFAVAFELTYRKVSGRRFDALSRAGGAPSADQNK